MQTKNKAQLFFSNRINKQRIVLLFLLCIAALISNSLLSAEKPNSQHQAWQILQTGLAFNEFKVKNKFTKKTAIIRILKIDPKYFKFTLINASNTKLKQNKTAKQWASKYKLMAAINASMFKQDNLSSTAYMRNYKHINNKKVGKDNSFLVFNKINSNLASVELLDRSCNRLNKLHTQYQTIIQNIRMLSCTGKNVWSKKNLFWSAALFGQDSKGNQLMIHVRSPFRMHDLVNHLRKLPIQLKRLMYLEGGPEAQLYLKTPQLEQQWVGSYETNFNENDNNKQAWIIPNVIGIKARK